MTGTHIPVSPDDDHDFRQLTGAFDHPIAPSPAFAERLRQQVTEANSKEREANVSHIPPAAKIVASPSRQGIAPMPKVRRSGGRILESIAAAILVFALLSSAILVNRLQDGGPASAPERQHLAAVTSPVANVTPEREQSTDSAWSDPGHTNAFPSGFDPLIAQPIEPLGNLEFDSDHGIIVGNTLVAYGAPSDPQTINERGEYALSAIDLPTGTERWYSARSFVGTYTTDEEAVYARVLDADQPGARSAILVALSLEDGEELWSYEIRSWDDTGLDIAGPGRPLPSGSPIVIDTTVYIAQTSGAVTALSAATGEVLWQSGDWDADLNPKHMGGSLVGNENHLYVVNGENSIEKLDRATGEVLGTFGGNYRPAPNFLTELHLQGDTIVMTAQDPYSFEPTSVFVDAMSTETGKVLWNTQGGPLAGSMVITGDIIGIPQVVDAPERAPAETGNVLVTFYDLDTGESLSQYGPIQSGSAALSASGSVVCIHETVPSISCVDFDDPDRTLRTIDIGATYTAEGPPSPLLFWKGNAIVLGHEGGPHIIRSTDPDAEQTPDATPVLNMQSDPGQTGRVSDQSPEMDGTIRITVNDLQIIQDPTRAMISGNFLITLDDASATPLKVRDLSTGETVWARQASTRGALAADAEYVYLAQPTDTQPAQVRLMALHLESGEVAWFGPQINNFDRFGYMTSGPVISGENIVVIDNTGQTYAVNRATGELRWQYPESPSEGSVTIDLPQLGSIAATQENIFVATRNQELLKLDAATGDVITSIDLTELIGEARMTGSLHVSNDRLALVVYSQQYETFGESSLILLDSDNL